uniref:Exostosin GT47 domain-containing protein n=2 Tax=Parascaris univalens TaxID=6257 RepID=A0A914ZQK2_PARUN
IAMKALTRYAILVASIFLLLFVILSHHISLLSMNVCENAPSYITLNHLHSIVTTTSIIEMNVPIAKCTMANCFNMSLCLSQKHFRVYVHPDNNASTISIVYANILKVLRESVYYTDDPNNACLFVLSIDTIDRDRKSENYVKHVDEQIEALPSGLWNGGRNHIIFNLYHGTYPDYSDHDLGFDVGYAMIARASANAQIFRPNFDLSFPLFHKEHSLRTVVESIWPLKLKDEYLVSFKGKRYVYGIGSETRDSLYHLHNAHSVVMVTTCKHNNDWKKYEDERCDEDNIEYERWDYETTMSNSTFCLTPRGRRLGSFRFLESLRLGCIPVILSDDWELPFSEIIDWSQAAVIAHEDTVLTISDVLKAIPFERVLYMKQQARGLYHRYFSSVEKIVLTSVQIIEERIAKQRGEEERQWNVISERPRLPLSNSACEFVILATNKVSGRLIRLVRLLSTLDEVVKITILWPKSRGIPPLQHDFSVETEVDVRLISNSDQSAFFNLTRNDGYTLVGGFVFFLDERVSISRDDVLFALESVQLEPKRLHGFYAASHKISGKVWTVETTPSNQYSIMLLHFVVLNKDYLNQFWKWVPLPAIELASRIPQCYTLLLNFMHTEISGLPPILIADRTKDPWMNSRNYTICLNKLSSLVWPSGVSLILSQIRIDRLLFVDDSGVVTR